MKLCKEFVLCGMLLLAVGCVMGDADMDLEIEQHVLPLQTIQITCSHSTLGPIRVTAQADSIYGNPCELFDGDVDTFALIGGYGLGASTKIRLESLNGQHTLTALHTQVGGTADLPASNRFEILAANCNESIGDIPVYRGYADKIVSLAFPGLCTTNDITIDFQRKEGDGWEYITELSPILYTPETPVTGDHARLINDQIIDNCSPTNVDILASADITDTNGAVVGKIELQRSWCSRPSSSAPVPVYHARARNGAGLPADKFASVFLRLRQTNGDSKRVLESIRTTWSEGTSSLRSHLWAYEPAPDLSSIVACARFYPPSATTPTSGATASGCTARVALP